jgi:hypothetical protein
LAQAFLEELQAFADRDDGSDYEMSASEVMSDEEFECLGEELESAGRVGSAPLGLSYLGPDERKTVWAKDREVYDWMVRSLKAWDRVGSRKEFLKSLGSRVSGRGCVQTCTGTAVRVLYLYSNSTCTGLLIVWSGWEEICADVFRSALSDVLAIASSCSTDHISSGTFRA